MRGGSLGSNPVLIRALGDITAAAPIAAAAVAANVVAATALASLSPKDGARMASADVIGAGPHMARNVSGIAQIVKRREGSSPTIFIAAVLSLAPCVSFKGAIGEPSFSMMLIGGGAVPSVTPRGADDEWRLLEDRLSCLDRLGYHKTTATITLSILKRQRAIDLESFLVKSRRQQAMSDSQRSFINVEEFPAIPCPAL